MRHLREEPDETSSDGKGATEAPQSVEAVGVEDGAGDGAPDEDAKRDDGEAHAHSRSNEAAIGRELDKDCRRKGHLWTGC